MSVKPYKPGINVLHIENDPQVREAFSKLFFERNIYVYSVETLSDAKKIIRGFDVDIIVSDGMFPTNTGGIEKKNFIPLVRILRRSKINSTIIAWSNSTHVHEFCKKEKILSFSKVPVTREQFKNRGRKYIEVEVKTPERMVEFLAEKFLAMSGLRSFVENRRLEFYYSEPATILAMFMALDTRTGLFEKTAGLNYGPLVTDIKNGLFTGYFDPTNDTAISRSIYHKILHENYFPKVEKIIRLKSKQLITFSRTLRQLDYGKMSNKKLAKLYLEFCRRFMAMRAYTSLPTALEHLSNVWTELLRGILAKRITDVSELNEALSVLTSPNKVSYVTEFETAVARVGLVKANGGAFEEVAKQVAGQFAWIHYTFEGVPITAKDVIEKIEQLGKTAEDFKRFIEDQAKRLTEVVKRKKEMIGKYRLTDKETELFRIGSEIVFIKFFRKGIFAESYYSVEFLLEAIAGRVGCTRKQTVNMFAREVLAALKLGGFPGELIESRLKQSVMWSFDGGSYPLSFEVKKFYEKAIIKDNLLQEIKGQVAQVGKVSGAVKVVNIPDDMKKMNEGDILVSRSTNPSLITAMRKAGAFVTDAGGLTCHAAIVAREMKKPCVVGTKTATQVLKDGDMVEVDANRGVVTIIKKA